MKKSYLFLLSLLLISCNTTNNSSDILSKSSTNELSSINSTETNSFTSEIISNEINSYYSSNDESSINSIYSENETILANEEKINRLLDGATIDDNNFIEYYKKLDINNNEISSNAIYASPNGNGEGTYSNPYSLQDALDNVKTGETLYLLEGTYLPENNEGFFITKSGNSNSYITIKNYPNAKVTITNNASGNELYGFQLDPNVSYLIIEGLEIANIKAQNAYGIAIWGNNQNHLIIRNNHIHNIETTSKDPEHDEDSSANGILINGENKKSVSNVIISDNIIENNITGWAESLSVAGNCEYIYVLNNTLDNNTNIGIDFYGNAEYCNDPSLDQPRYCVAAGNNISRSICSYADCAGLYVDGARDIILQYNKVSNSLYGIEIGSEQKKENTPVKNIIVRGNILENNKVLAIRVGGYEENQTGIVYDTYIYNNTIVNNTKITNEIILAKCDNVSFYNNIFYTKCNEIIATDFNENYTKSISFTNNIFYSINNNEDNISFYMMKKTLTFKDFNNKYGNNFYTKIEIENDYSVNNDICSQTKTADIKYDYYLKTINVLKIGAVC